MQIKPIKTGFVANVSKSITQIYNGNKMVNIVKYPDRIEKLYVDTSSMKILKKIVDVFKK